MEMEHPFSSAEFYDAMNAFEDADEPTRRSQIFGGGVTVAGGVVAAGRAVAAGGAVAAGRAVAAGAAGAAGAAEGRQARQAGSGVKVAVYIHISKDLEKQCYSMRFMASKMRFLI